MRRLLIVFVSVFAAQLFVREAHAKPSPLAGDGKASGCARGAPEHIMAKVQQTYRKKALTASFEQQYVDAVTGPKAKEQGTLALDAKGRMRFAYEVPEKKVFVFDGQSAAFVEPDAKQVTVLDRFEQSHAGAALGLLTGNIGDLAGIALDAAGSAKADADKHDGKRRLIFRPTDKQPSFQRAELTIDAKRCEVEGVRVIDAIGNESTYVLKKRVLNATLDEHLFAQQLPEGFDVLHVDASPQGARAGD